NGHGELGRCRLLAVLVDDCGVVVVTGFGRCLSGELAVGVRLHGRVAVGGHSLSGACIGLSGLPGQFHLDVRGSLSGDLSAFDDGLVPDLRSFGLLVAIGIRISFIVLAVSGGGGIRVLTVGVSVSVLGVGVSVGIGLIVLRISVSVGLGLIAIGSRGSICVLTVGISVSVLLCIVAAVIRLGQLEVHARLFKRVAEVGNPAHASVSGATGNNTDSGLTLVNGTAGVTLLREHPVIGFHLEAVDDP